MLRRERRLDGLYGFWNDVMQESLGETLEKFAGYFRRNLETKREADGSRDGDQGNSSGN